MKNKSKTARLWSAHVPVVYAALEVARKQWPVTEQRPAGAVHHRTSIYPK